jgi:hypothetical protein
MTAAIGIDEGGRNPACLRALGPVSAEELRDPPLENGRLDHHLVQTDASSIELSEPVGGGRDDLRAP